MTSKTGTSISIATSADPSTTKGRASASVYAIRSAGYDGSTGRYPPPALTTARSATTNSTERGNKTATSDSGPTPNSTSLRASRFAKESSSLYVRRRPSKTTAIASGVSRTCDSNIAARVASAFTLTPGTAHSPNTSARSEGASNSMSPTTTPELSATASSTRTRRDAIDATVDSSKRSVA